jgi:heat shock protein HslJ
MAVTMMYCPIGMDQEQAYLSSLESTQSLSINAEGRLEIIYDSGQPYEEKLVFAEGETPLVNTQWLLIGFGEPGTPTPVEAGTTITAIFSEDGNVSGSSGCNHYAGSYETNEDQLTIGPLATTGAICPVGAEQEQSFLEAFGDAHSYQIFGQNLRLSYGEGEDVLIFTSANLPLEGTLWTLASFQGEPVPPEISITALFEPGDEEEPSSVAGSAGCNTYSAAYQVDDDQLTITTPITTLKACEIGMEQETAYLAAIEGEQSFQIIGDNLDIQTETGTLSYVADRTPLIGALWVLVAMGDAQEPTQPVEDSNFTAQFTRNPDAPSGVVAGTTGCNEYSAAYTANLEEIKINLPDLSGGQVCSPGLQEQEQQFFLGMNAARSYYILGDTLFMPYDEGRQVLIFAATQTHAAGKRPLTDLDGTHWFLHYINDSPILPGTLIDARFTINPDGRAGRIAGDAGCNTYNAGFTQEIGVETSLSSSTLCFTPDGVMDQENAYLSALGRSYGYWLTGNQLVINTGLGALTYRQNPPDSSQDQAHLLQNVKWYLIYYNDKSSVVGNAEPSLFFNLDNTFFGNTGCNDLNGVYETALEMITIINVQVGEQACPDETSDKQERVIVANLEAAETYVVADTGMQIASERGILSYSTTPVVRPEPGEPPTAAINAPEQASVGEVVRFDGSASTSEIGITDYRWDFGDGTLAQGQDVEHIYISPGLFEVTLVVVDKIGQRGSAVQPIEIIAQPPEVIPPTAVIEGPDDGFVAEPVTFSASSSSSGSSPITTFIWDFGDGSPTPSSPNNTVTKLYEIPGSFTVTLTATDANGLSDSDSMQIEIDTRLEGPVWSLYPVLTGTSITMQFLQGELVGFSGCNTYSGTYTASINADGSAEVQIRDLQITQRSCAEDIMEQEAEYLTALAVVNLAGIEGNILTLTGEDVELTFYEVGTPKPEEVELLR